MDSDSSAEYLYFNRDDPDEVYQVGLLVLDILEEDDQLDRLGGLAAMCIGRNMQLAEEDPRSTTEQGLVPHFEPDHLCERLAAASIAFFEAYYGYGLGTST